MFRIAGLDSPAGNRPSGVSVLSPDICLSAAGHWAADGARR